MTTTNGNQAIPPNTPVSAKRDRTPALLLAVILLTGLLLIYAAQTGLGRWQVDEFRYFADHRALGWRAYFARFYVSPRPLSEFLIYVYGAIVLAADRPFIPQALLTLWAASLFSIAAAAHATLRRAPGRRLAAAAFGLAPMLFILQISPVTELFYWPIATVAYLPVVAAITSLMLLLSHDPAPATRQAWCCVALLVAALSHEIGAAFAIGFGLAAAALPRPNRQPILWWLAPALAGLLVMLALVLFRSDIVDLGSDTKPYTGRLIASALVALRQMSIDLITTSNFPHDALGITAALLQKSTFATGFALIWIRHGTVHPNRWHLSLAIGIAIAIFFSLLAAYYHYGELCCERHATARQWLIELLFILAATSALLRWPTRPGQRTAWLGPLLLIASLLPVIAQIPAIRADFGQMAIARSARFKTWQSSLAPGPQMQFYMPPDNVDMLIHGTSTTVGTYDLATRSPDPNDLVAAIGRFFRKTTVVACQAWQTQDSFLIDGTFIPACPPHDGPPDIVFNTH